MTIVLRSASASVKNSQQTLLHNKVATRISSTVTSSMDPEGFHSLTCVPSNNKRSNKKKVTGKASNEASKMVDANNNHQVNGGGLNVTVQTKGVGRGGEDTAVVVTPTMSLPLVEKEKMQRAGVEKLVIMDERMEKLRVARSKKGEEMMKKLRTAERLEEILEVYEDFIENNYKIDRESLEYALRQSSSTLKLELKETSFRDGIVVLLGYKWAMGDKYRIPSVRGTFRDQIKDSQEKKTAFSILLSEINNRLGDKYNEHLSFEKYIDFPIGSWVKKIRQKSRKPGVWTDLQEPLTKEMTTGLYYKHYKTLIKVDHVFEKNVDKWWEQD